MNPVLSVIIVNYNGLKYLESCFNSLYQNLDQIPFEIIVLDNNSTDESCNFILENYPQIKLIQSQINHGFGKGNNEAVKYAKGKYLLLINNDTIVLNQLKPVLDFLQSDAKNGVVAIKMIDGNKNYLQCAGNFPNYKTLFQFKNLLSLGFEFKTGNFSKSNYKVDWLCGSFLMLPTKVYQQINGFDEAYFMYVEDVDFCKKIANLGYHRVFLPQFSYIHFVGFSSSKNPLLVKGYNIYIQKHFTGFTKIALQFILNCNGFVKKTKSLLKTN